MEQNIKTLLYSDNLDDVILGIIIARKMNVDPVEIDNYIDNYAFMVGRMIGGDSSDAYRNIFDKYLERGTGKNKLTSFQYVKWKEDE